MSDPLSKSGARFFVVGTPVGNLGDMTLRGIEVLKSVDLIYCEDTRHTLKLLNHFEIQKPLRSCPYFKEKGESENLLRMLSEEKRVAFVSDAGTPGLNDPGALLVRAVRDAGFDIEIIGGVSSLTYFISGLGMELESFEYVGFLPPRRKDRETLFTLPVLQPRIFLESPHRIESTLEVLSELKPEMKVTLAKELSKISEGFFEGTSSELKTKIRSFKGEWIGCLWPDQVKTVKKKKYSQGDDL